MALEHDRVQAEARASHAAGGMAKWGQIKMSTLGAQPEVARESVTQQLLGAYACGKFFRAPPMCLYGGSPLAFAACCGLRKAVAAMVEAVPAERGLWTCDSSTGITPLHAVAATASPNRCAMYDLLTSTLQFGEKAASPEAAADVRLGSTLMSMTPMQLAARLGDKSMFEHALKQRLIVMWQWGPAVGKRLSLAGIDSTGAGAGDVMELVTHSEALPATRELLLDACMGGLLHRLFTLKWDRFAKCTHRT
jgi:hypothetical protein